MVVDGPFGKASLLDDVLEGGVFIALFDEQTFRRIQDLPDSFLRASGPRHRSRPQTDCWSVLKIPQRMSGVKQNLLRLTVRCGAVLHTHREPPPRYKEKTPVDLVDRTWQS